MLENERTPLDTELEVTNNEWEENTEEETTSNKNRYQSADERLLRAHVAIENAITDADIQNEMSEYGYTREKLEKGMALYNEARALVIDQRDQYGAQHDSTEVINNTWKDADDRYMKTLKVARIALRDDRDAQTSLMFSGARKRSFSGWTDMAFTFYVNLLNKPEWITAMGEFGYDEPKLQNEHDQVLALMKTNANQEKRKGAAQHKTKARDAKLDELDQWMRDFKSIAQIALEENPQWQEKLSLGAI